MKKRDHDKLNQKEELIMAKEAYKAIEDKMNKAIHVLKEELAGPEGRQGKSGHTGQNIGRLLWGSDSHKPAWQHFSP